MIYWYDQKQFWTAWRERKGYVITKGETKISALYQDMILFMTDIMPLTYDEISRFPYRQFFRTLRMAKDEGKRREAEYNKLKSKRRS